MTKKQEDTFGPEGSKPNPELYEAIKEKDSTPLEYSQAVATGYVSTRGSFQDMFDKIAAGTAKTIEGLRDPETQAARLQDRIDSREARADKKGTATTYNDDKTVDVKGDAKRDEFDEKTEKLKTRQKTYQDRVDADMQKRIEQAQKLRGTLSPEEKEKQTAELYNLMNSKSGKKWEDADQDERDLFYYQTDRYKQKTKVPTSDSTSGTTTTTK